MSLAEKRHGVWLGDRRIATLNQRGDYTWFAFTEEYMDDPHRPVLGLIFEQDLHAHHGSALRLPPWFSNLLPEGELRRWIAADRDVSIDREMELLSQVGRDLPGAVRVLAEDESPDALDSGVAWAPDDGDAAAVDHPGWRFSLAGVGLKFSMVTEDSRLTLPGSGEGGEWIVKLPDQLYADVPRNEFAMMSLASAAGIEVPQIRLVRRDDVIGLPANVWPRHEEWALAVRRFDREERGNRVHIEDLAQVRNVYQERKYEGNFETVASLVYRGRDLNALQEFTRRLAFIILIADGDAHLKNWSLIYRDPRVPTLSPAYDLVSTAPYHVGDEPEDLGLKLGGTRRVEAVRLASFGRIERRLRADGANLAGIAAETIDRVCEAWPTYAALLSGNRELQDSIGSSISNRRQTLMKGSS